MKSFCFLIALVTIVSASFFLDWSFLKAPSSRVLAQDLSSESPIQTTGELSAPTTVTGKNMKAFVVAWDAFKQLSDLPDEKKNLESYAVIISSDSRNFYVVFKPNLLAAAKGESAEKLRNRLESTNPGRDSSNGRWVSYTIRQKDYKIVKRTYLL